MSAPIPDKPLSGHCSVIDNDTLYVLSPDSFQALSLKENATWSSLSMGTAVTNPACVHAVPNGDESQAALYVVGGEAEDGGYGGLQRYTFASKSWDTLDPTTSDMSGRTNHGAAYLNDSSSILVYAGYRSDSPATLSTQTFLISTESPYNIESFTSKAPPVSGPILLPWNSSSAVMLGGSDDNTEIWTFSPSQGWQRLETDLTSALSANAKGALVTGSDGSKVLEVYDASVSPNTLSQLVLLDADGKTATTGQTVGSSSTKSRKRKRNLDLASWPTYNSSSAPSTKRSDYSVAQNAGGTLSVVSGGNDDSPLNIFNQTGNTWVSNEAYFGSSSDQKPLNSASASSSASLGTSTTNAAATSTSTSSPSGGGGSSSSSNTGKILGAVFGTLCGIAIILAILLLCFRRRKQKKAKQQVLDEKAERMSFQDRGASFMKEAGGATVDPPLILPPTNRFNHSSYDPRSSFAILAGKLGADRLSNRFSKYGGAEANRANSTSPYGLAPPNKPFQQRNDSTSSLDIVSGKPKGHNRNNTEKGSFESTAKLVRSPKSPQSFDDPLELEEIDNRQDGQLKRPAQAAQPAAATVRAVAQVESPDMQNKKRSSGWSRYFANQNDGGIYDPAVQNVSSQSLSQYTSSQANPSRNPSALVSPLDLERGHLHPSDAQRVSVVPNGRPSFSNSVEDFAARGASLDMAQGQQADFHTGHSLESQSFLDTRESCGSDRRHSMGSVTSAEFLSNGDESWTRVNSAGVAQKINNNTSSVKEVQISASPATSASQFPRPPSSSYTADSRINSISTPDALGRALSPPAAVAIPGPAARAGNGGGFFPGSGTRAFHDRPSTGRKIGPLHPGTLAALRFDPKDAKPSTTGLGIAGTEDNRDSSATIWPSAGSAGTTKEEREQAFRERLQRERQEKAKKDEATGTRKTAASDISWFDIGQK